MVTSVSLTAALIACKIQKSSKNPKKVHKVDDVITHQIIFFRENGIDYRVTRLKVSQKTVTDL